METFTIRVYGVLIHGGNKVLVSDEWIRGKYYTKFPGGGLEYGEGTRDCLKREFKEELNLEVKVEDHLYTTDFFQESAFGNARQIIAIYYYVKALEPLQIPLADVPFSFTDEQLQQYEIKNETESFRLIPLETFNSANVTLPIDKIVADIIAPQVK